MQEQLKAVGIDLRIDNRPANVFATQGIRRRQFPHMLMWASSQSPYQLGFIFWHSSQVPTATNNWEGVNTSGWRHPENDRLLEQIAQELDVGKRVTLLRRQQEIWAEELPSIPLYFRVAVMTSKKSLKNVKPSPFTINVKPELWEWGQ